jgi:cellulose synthase (UDP-forming)
MPVLTTSDKKMTNSIKAAPEGHKLGNYLVKVLDKRQSAHLYLLTGLWLITTVAFAIWWLQPAHFTGPFRFAFNSFIVAWGLIIPGYYFYFLRQMKKPNPDVEAPSSWRIAMVTTRAASEPFAQVKQTLLAMKAQLPLHDTWLADEDVSPEILKWCADHGVFVSCRKGVAGYHNDTWPRRKKCKEGNLAYFYDTYGYDNYDFVSQLDADHVPAPGYLKAMLAGFHDPAVGYVSAPSICDANAKNSWASRGRLFLESTLHGTLQAGYNNKGWSPMCIGSHYSVRTVALRESGGLGPELAEDHSTTLLLCAHGWRGIHSIDAIAHGDGPAAFPDAMVQEFQWARSLVMIFLGVTPLYLGKMPFTLQFQFLFGELWYFFFSGAMLSSYLLPLIALVIGVPFAHVRYTDFLAWSALPTLSALSVILWVKKQELLRPVNAKIFGWEMILFQLARWPWVVCAIIDAAKCSITKTTLDWKITPKARANKAAIPASMFIPYIIIVAASSIVDAVHVNTPYMSGYFYLTTFNIITYVLLIVTIAVCHGSENRRENQAK